MAGPTPDAVHWTFGETKAYLSAQVGAIKDTEGKAAEVLRFNSLLAGVLVAAGSFLYQAASDDRPPPPWVLVLLAAGLASVVLSTMYAMLAYQKKAVVIGLPESRLVESLDYDVDAHTLRAAAVRIYAKGIRHNAGLMDRSARLFAASMRWLLAGVALLGLSALVLLVRGAD